MTETPRTELTALPEMPKTPELLPPPPDVQVEGAPRSGVEILAVEERDGTRYYTVRDLHNKSTVRNVTKKSARDLWLYAIMQHANDIYDANTFDWHNERAVLSRSQRAGKVRYDLALRDAAGRVHIFFGVADDAIDSRWKELIQLLMPPEPTSSADASAPSESPEMPASAQPYAESEVAEPAPADQVPVADPQPVADNTPVTQSQD